MLSMLLLSIFGTETITITDITVIDSTSIKPRPHQYVTIEDDKITSVSNKKSAAGTIVNGKGKFLIPGLWDMHVHMTGMAGMAEMYLANGVLGIRDMFTPMSSVQSARKNKLSPTVVAAGRIVDGPKPIWPGSVAVSTPEEGRQAVTTVKAEGSDFVKVYSLLSRESYFAIADEAKKQKMVFAGHVPNSVSVIEASNAGQKSMEHLYGILKACSSKEADLDQHPEWSRLKKAETLVESYDPTKAKAVFDTFKRNGSWQCPTLIVLRNIANLRDPELKNDPRLSLVSPIFKSMWDPANDFRFKSWTEDDWKAAKLSYERQLQLVKDMVKSGVQIIAGTDTGNPYVFAGSSLHEELELYVRAGLTPAEALKTATLNPARYLGLEKTRGTIEKGKIADLVLLDENPLTDIKNTTKIAAVIKGGVHYDKAALKKLLEKARP